MSVVQGAVLDKENGIRTNKFLSQVSVVKHPSEAKWISKEEKDWIESKLHEEQEALGTYKSEKVPLN